LLKTTASLNKIAGSQVGGKMKTGFTWGAAPGRALKRRRIWRRRRHVSHRGFMALGAVIAAFAFSPSQAAAHARAHAGRCCPQTTLAGYSSTFQ
jgi:hypothetical protein